MIRQRIIFTLLLLSIFCTSCTKNGLAKFNNSQNSEASDNSKKIQEELVKPNTPIPTFTRVSSTNTPLGNENEKDFLAFNPTIEIYSKDLTKEFSGKGSNLIGEIKTITNSVKDYFKKDSIQRGAISITQIKLFKISDTPDFYVTVKKENGRWSYEGFSLFLFSDNKLIFLNLGEEPYIQINFTRIKGFMNPFVEVYNSTHMGNGSLTIYELNKHIPEEVIHSIGVDNHWELREMNEYGKVNGWDKSYCKDQRISTILRGGKTKVTYSDLNYDGIEDIVIDGYYDTYIHNPKLDIDSMFDPDKNKKIASTYIKNCYIYNKDSHLFEFSKVKSIEKDVYKYIPTIKKN